LRDFRNQVGDTEAIRQIKWAMENGYTASNDALDFLETQSPLLPDKIQTLSPVQSAVPILNSENKETQLVTFEQETPDLPADLASSLKNSLIVGVPGSGKGILVTNALEHLKQDKQRQVTVFYIDPKNDPNETSYFSGRVDYLFRQDLMTCDAVEAYNWLQNCIQKFDEFNAELGYKLLVFDELNLVTKTLKRVEGALGWLEGKLTGYSSSGSSRGIVLWGISQNAHTKGLGFDGGTRSIFIPVFIVSTDNISASEGILRATMIPSDRKLSTTQIQSLCQKSPVGRAIFYGGLNEWFPMPKLTNYSGFDRDNRRFINEQPTIPQDVNTSGINQKSRQKMQVLSHSERIIQMLTATSESSLLEFINKELNVTNHHQKEQVMAGIIEVLQSQGRFDLIAKFGL